MSIEIMTKVWKSSGQRGSRLLLLLALADHASDDGVCYPGIASLARKTRKGKRQTQRLLSDLEQSGELFINRNTGRSNTNLYLITVGFDVSEIMHTLMKRFEFEATEARKVAEEIIIKGDTNTTFSESPENEKGDISKQKDDILDEKVTSGTEKDDIAMSSESSLEPSINRQESSDLAPSGAQTDLPSDPARLPEMQMQSEIFWGPGGRRDPAIAKPDPAAEWAAPVRELADQIGVDVEKMPDKTRAQWGRKLAKIAEPWGTDPPTLAQAIRGLFESADYAWKTYSGPYSSFEYDIAVILGRMKSGEPLSKKTGGSHATGNKRTQLTYEHPIADDATADAINAARARAAAVSEVQRRGLDARRQRADP